MTWYQLEIANCPHEQVDEFSETLVELGALSVSLCDMNDDPILEPLPNTTPLWQHVIIKALFNSLSDLNQVQTHLEHEYPSYSLSKYQIEDLDWERAWMKDFHPMQFGNSLWICPSWANPPDPNAVNIMLDPGLAFGTGTHPTTALCLEWLEQQNLNGKTIIDYGCGSGILSIAALKLGALHACAVDIDSQALSATQSNAKNNDISIDRLSVGKPQDITKKADIIIANILINPLIALKSNFLNLLNDSGKLVMSGLLTEQSSQIIEHYESDFIITGKKEIDDWCLIQALKK